MVNTIHFDPTDEEITDVQQEKIITLEDLTENGKEKLADLSDEKIQELKQKAIEEENYDIAKLIKIEQDERKEKAKEAEEKIKEEEKEHEKIQEKITFSHEENLEKAQELIAQLNKENSDKKEESNENNIESKISEISDEEIIIGAELQYIVTEWRYRDNDRMLKRLGDYPTKEDIPRMRKYMEEHPEEGITDKQSYYEITIEEIRKLVKESDDEYDRKGIMSGNPETLEKMMKGLSILAEKMRDAGMKGSAAYEKGEKIYNYFNRKKELLEEYLNLPGPNVRRVRI